MGPALSSWEIQPHRWRSQLNEGVTATNQIMGRLLPASGALETLSLSRVLALQLGYQVQWRAWAELSSSLECWPLPQWPLHKLLLMTQAWSPAMTKKVSLCPCRVPLHTLHENTLACSEQRELCDHDAVGAMLCGALSCSPYCRPAPSKALLSTSHLVLCLVVTRAVNLISCRGDILLPLLSEHGGPVQEGSWGEGWWGQDGHW